MQKLKAKFGKKQEPSRLSSSLRDFIKGSGDEGLQSLPYILECCSSAAEYSLTSQVEVLDTIAKYYAQHDRLGRQLRCIDLLRYLSDQHDNELFNLLRQGHPILKTIDTNLKTTRAQSALQKGTRTLLDHLVRQPGVPDAIIELHAKHVHGFRSPHKPTIILSDQEVVADDIEAASAEAELLATLLTDSSPDKSLFKEVYTRMKNTRERLVRDIDTSTNEAQTVNLINSVENIDQVMLLYKEMHPKDPGATRRRSSTANSDSSESYTAPSRIEDERRPSTDSVKVQGKRNGKSKATSPAASPPQEYDFSLYKTVNATNLSRQTSEEGPSSVHYPSHYQDNFGDTGTQKHVRVSSPSPVLEDQPTTDLHRLGSNNPFAKPQPPEKHSLSPSNPFAAKTERSTSLSKNPFGPSTSSNSADYLRQPFDTLHI
ncbi:protein of unknown function [Taphrina deformans PYCC 5710]|uniref:GAT domain-containing protein n=1 Tax=Taphrina deformans (strain PYCC 5710 / ATCC 11124 / CBS 356.35 / IMI 108563 / JCM 9778 / NBRC 8474) TaxID=1097556 RepID=R4XD14_TAPDE|nr:protein of unknown function [Taphrina deformans PYCC 5710]|eukprot:CCG83498.1 protein of unknown function [Taphrina deformans PYCC 5710]